MLDGDGIDNLLELSVRLNKSTQFSKQYEKYQVLQEDQDQRVQIQEDQDQRVPIYCRYRNFKTWKIQ